MHPESPVPTGKPALATRRHTRLPLAIAVIATGLLAVCTFATTRFAGERSALSFERQLRVSELTATVQHLDEVLTMSANMAAATGDSRWRTRYDAHAGRLDATIAALRAVSPELFDQQMGQDTIDSNRRLADLETRALELVAARRGKEAMAVLDGPDYAADKARHAEGNRAIQVALTELVARERDEARLVTALLIVATLAFTVLASASWVVLARRSREERAEAELAVARAMSKAADESNRAKTQFVANISHELRTPLTAILGYADLLAEPGYPESQREDACTTILRNGEHLLQVINDLLDMSKIEAGTVAIDKVATDPALIVEDVVSLMRVRAQAKHLELERTFATSLPRRIQTDPVRLRQILMNLVGNAIKFTATGRVLVRISYDPAAAVPHLAFAIEDSGIGMNAAQKSRLFRAFVQGDDSTERRFGGTGLGLAISQRYAQLLGGGIDVRSEPGTGSEFTLSLALAEAADAELWQPDADALAERRSRSTGPVPQGEAASLHGVRILLAEDGRDNQRLVTHHLQKAGGEVVVVENGRQAVDLLASGTERFSLVLMDMQMPELDGYRATRLLRERGWAVPIIALTANAMSTDRERCLQAGCDDYLSKPIDRAQLVATCARWAAVSVSAGSAAT